MITYSQLPKTSEGSPPDVEAITDDGNAEMVALTDLINEGGFEILLPKDRDEDGKFHFTIPGDQVGEFSEYTYDVDGGLLEQEMEKWNQAAIEAAENG